MSFIQVPVDSNKDLVTASTEKLEYFPKSEPSGAGGIDKEEWLEVMSEKAECSE